MPRDIKNTYDFESTVQRRVLGRIFGLVDLECDEIRSITEYRTGRIVATFGPKAKPAGESVTRLEIR